MVHLLKTHGDAARIAVNIWEMRSFEAIFWKSWKFEQGETIRHLKRERERKRERENVSKRWLQYWTCPVKGM